MMLRATVQFHWRNEGYADFDDFLARMNHDKRKKIQQERRRVRDAGISFRWLRGAEATQADWRFFVDCYNRDLPQPSFDALSESRFLPAPGASHARTTCS